MSFPGKRSESYPRNLTIGVKHALWPINYGYFSYRPFRLSRISNIFVHLRFNVDLNLLPLQAYKSRWLEINQFRVKEMFFKARTFSLAAIIRPLEKSFEFVANGFQRNHSENTISSKDFTFDVLDK